MDFENLHQTRLAIGVPSREIVTMSCVLCEEAKSVSSVSSGKWLAETYDDNGVIGSMVLLAIRIGKDVGFLSPILPV